MAPEAAAATAAAVVADFGPRQSRHLSNSHLNGSEDFVRTVENENGSLPQGQELNSRARVPDPFDDGARMPSALDGASLLLPTPPSQNSALLLSHSSEIDDQPKAFPSFGGGSYAFEGSPSPRSMASASFSWWELAADAEETAGSAVAAVRHPTVPARNLQTLLETSMVTAGSTTEAAAACAAEVSDRCESLPPSVGGSEHGCGRCISPSLSSRASITAAAGQPPSPMPSPGPETVHEGERHQQREVPSPSVCWSTCDNSRPASVGHAAADVPLSPARTSLLEGHAQRSNYISPQPHEITKGAESAGQTLLGAGTVIDSPTGANTVSRDILGDYKVGVLHGRPLGGSLRHRTVADGLRVSEAGHEEPETEPGEAAASLPRRLVVSIIRATGLRSLNWTGDAPRCSCKVQHTEGSLSRPSTLRVTRALRGTYDPEWNETHEVEPWYVGEALEFTVYDDELIGPKAEAWAALPSHLFYPAGFDGHLPIVGCDTAFLHVRIAPAAFQLPAPPQSGSPHVVHRPHFIEAKLKPTSHAGTPTATDELRQGAAGHLSDRETKAESGDAVNEASVTHHPSHDNTGVTDLLCEVDTLSDRFAEVRAQESMRHREQRSRIELLAKRCQELQAQLEVAKEAEVLLKAELVDAASGCSVTDDLDSARPASPGLFSGQAQAVASTAPPTMMPSTVKVPLQVSSFMVPRNSFGPFGAPGEPIYTPRVASEGSGGRARSLTRDVSHRNGAVSMHDFLEEQRSTRCNARSVGPACLELRHDLQPQRSRDSTPLRCIKFSEKTLNPPSLMLGAFAPQATCAGDHVRSSN
eukprot:TRINITY_DN48861_c0_g1_i1.p1 TRINITY_DN48861_c0_g1~~TRINITY_DN48861_c0_g1_i1.p1  ORF type:complete len:863 (+),score=104.49 TRINITY_DN48861_c0_g1_i1:153-2591(+)